MYTLSAASSSGCGACLLLTGQGTAREPVHYVTLCDCQSGPVSVSGSCLGFVVCTSSKELIGHFPQYVLVPMYVFCMIITHARIIMFSTFHGKCMYYNN